QGRLYGFLLSILGNPDQANEVLQETNLVLCRKSSEFQPGTSFKAWSFRVASLQAMAFRQKQRREKLVFDESVFEELVCESTNMDKDNEFEALQTCLNKLPEFQLELISKRYMDGLSIREVAKKMEKKETAITTTIYRIRKSLYNCMQLKALQA
ncbi:MAG: sigma-70 family RNA polymerase sigma factor, partial [Planctomycetes bacterium]|nr:sigma-70 family RNA polymerase sigma factor [Planctomycetota bacterium]